MGQISVEDLTTELTAIAVGDLFLVTDISEALDADKSKKVTFATLEKYTSLILETAKSDTHTFELADAGKVISLTGAVGKTFTVPPNVDVAFLLGTFIGVVKDGTGDVTIAEGAAVTIKTEIGLVVTEQYAMAGIIKVDTDVWRAVGSLNVS